MLVERDLSPSSSYNKFIYINYHGDTMHSSTEAKAFHRLQNLTFWKESTCDRCAQPKSESFRHWPSNKPKTLSLVTKRTTEEKSSNEVKLEILNLLFLCCLGFRQRRAVSQCFTSSVQFKTFSSVRRWVLTSPSRWQCIEVFACSTKNVYILGPGPYFLIFTSISIINTTCNFLQCP